MGLSAVTTWFACTDPIADVWEGPWQILESTIATPECDGPTEGLDLGVDHLKMAFGSRDPWLVQVNLCDGPDDCENGTAWRVVALDALSEDAGSGTYMLVSFSPSTGGGAGFCDLERTISTWTLDGAHAVFAFDTRSDVGGTAASAADCEAAGAGLLDNPPEDCTSRMVIEARLAP